MYFGTRRQTRRPSQASRFQVAAASAGADDCAAFCARRQTWQIESRSCGQLPVLRVPGRASSRGATRPLRALDSKSIRARRAWSTRRARIDSPLPSSVTAVRWYVNSFKEGPSAPATQGTVLLIKTRPQGLGMLRSRTPPPASRPRPRPPGTADGADPPRIHRSSGRGGSLGSTVYGRPTGPAPASAEG